MSADEMGWPDKDRPGVPCAPNQDGPHVLRTPWGDQVVRHWYANREEWSDGPGWAHPLDGWVYLGPVRTDADLRAASAVGFKAGLEAAAARIVRLRANAKWAPAIDMRYKDGAFDGWAAAHIALTALTPPSDLDEALATALEQARMEGRKEEREARIEHAPASKALAWLARHPECELSHGADELDEPGEWRVHSMSGGINDREWTLIGSGPTPLKAIQAALRALAAQPHADGGGS